MFEGFEHGRFVSEDGVDIAYVQGGDGPPVLMLHGYPQTKEMWARVAPVLAMSFTVVCADLRGYGASSKPRCAADQSTYSFRSMAKDQLQLMQELGFESFHLVGHDRGARTAYRMALDHPAAVASLSLLDIVPTNVMFERMNSDIAHAYWHWPFLSQPAPLPEHIIGADPDRFFDTCLVSWGAASIETFDQHMLDAYRAAWRDPDMIYASCADYRAARHVDWALDAASAQKKVSCPTLVLYGSKGLLARLFDIPATWQQRCEHLVAWALPGGHFFVDQLPTETSGLLSAFLSQQIVQS
ncbi:alpha/beta fold hydrolase [Aquisediminimonas sediminicola]|uniref:alpha/beta fold hydrolase n=1 Tax=Alteraquisediminimonas sediminicola TaxID=2676787 RepID=UPI001C8D1B64|nr:alpha/beta hydrolase [Aquisediminimonas sediminicola]